MSEKVDNTGKPYVREERDEHGGVSYLREDGLWDMPVDLSKDVIAHLALIAHNRDITLNELMLEILEEQVEKPEKD